MPCLTGCASDEPNVIRRTSPYAIQQQRSAKRAVRCRTPRAYGAGADVWLPSPAASGGPAAGPTTHGPTRAAVVRSGERAAAGIRRGAERSVILGRAATDACSSSPTASRWSRTCAAVERPATTVAGGPAVRADSSARNGRAAAHAGYPATPTRVGSDAGSALKGTPAPVGDSPAARSLCGARRWHAPTHVRTTAASARLRGDAASAVQRGATAIRHGSAVGMDVSASFRNAPASSSVARTCTAVARHERGRTGAAIDNSSTTVLDHSATLTLTDFRSATIGWRA
jgi:hypothetical protein